MINIGEAVFYEKINSTKLKYIIDNKDTYREIIENEEKEMRRNKNNQSTVCPFTIFKKILKNSIPIPNTEFSFIKVKYQKGKSSDDIGRWYAVSSIGLAPLCGCVRHTICENIWIDIDQVNSHPTIMKTFMNQLKYTSHILDECVGDRENLLKKIMVQENCERDKAKQYVISAINGGKFKTAILKQLIDEIKPCITHIINSPEYKNIYDYCKKIYGEKHHNLSGKTISRILQVVENKLLENYLVFSINNDLIPKFKDGYQVSLIFDGFQLIKNKRITNQLLEEMRKQAFDEIGYDIPLKIKPFDNSLDLPDNYYESNISEVDIEPEVNDNIPDDIKEYCVVKKEFEKYVFKTLYPPMVFYEKRRDVQPLSIKSSRETYSHLTCWKYDKKKDERVISSFYPLWLLDPHIRHYEKICWKPPPLICHDADYNSWLDFEISKEPLIETKRDYWNEFKQYSDNLFGDKTISNYILARYAYRIQNPGLRSYVCVIYNGEEGDGKSKFIEVIYKIFGDCAIQIDKAKKLYETHSTFEQNKCYICVNEAAGTENFENSEVLKTRITEDKLNINPKGIQPYEIDNLCDYDMTTNNINVVKITDDSTRRWFQTRTTQYYSGNLSFFNDFITNIIENTDALRQIYEGLLRFNVQEVVPDGNFQSVKSKPETEITKEVKSCNRDKIIWWIEDYVNDDVRSGEDFLKKDNKDLFTNWCVWCENNRVTTKINSISFGIKVKDLGNKIKSKLNKDAIVKDPKHSKTTIDLEVIREYIEFLNT